MTYHQPPSQSAAMQTSKTQPLPTAEHMLHSLRARQRAAQIAQLEAMLKQSKLDKSWLEVLNERNQPIEAFSPARGERYPHGQTPDQQLADFLAALKAKPQWRAYSLSSESYKKLGDLSKLSPTARAEAMIKQVANATNWDYLIDGQTLRLWAYGFGSGEHTLESAKNFLLTHTHAGLRGWKLETYQGTPRLIDTSVKQRGGMRSLCYESGVQLIEKTVVGYMDSRNGGTHYDDEASILAYHTQLLDAPWDFAQTQTARHVVLADTNSNTPLALPQLLEPQRDWQGLSAEALYDELHQRGWALREAQSKQTLRPGQDAASDATALRQILAELDYRPARLPKLEAKDWSDPDKGLWEFFGADPKTLSELGLRARDPAQDVRALDVAIDFGTSSTVVALRNRNGSKELLRVGVRDFFQPVRAQDYENPTVLEFRHLEGFLRGWQARAYRPDTDWDDLCAANQARDDFRDNTHNPAVVRSVLMHIKRWARESGQSPLLLTDQHGRDFELPPLTARPPTRGVALQISPRDPLDPVELYAYFLGLYINWRQRGLFLRYHLTFPVKYEREVKDAILASFARGLQRSLPASLIEQSQELNRFSVSEVATEPTAFAAATLPSLNLHPKAEGLFYAVFDFGGGTTDFDFGLWRAANAEEEDQGYEHVFERLHAGGDPTLGGENILAHLAYRVFQANKDLCLQQHIRFTKPADATGFAGSEALIDHASFARANTASLMHKLRPFLEQPENWSASTLKLDLLNAEGEASVYELLLDSAELERYVSERVQRGVDLFLTELALAMNGEHPDDVHILLAGNASRGRWVRQAFDAQGEFWQGALQRAFGTAAIPSLTVHWPVVADDAEPYAATCKTAVALGALYLAPGKGCLQIDRMAQGRGDTLNAPFAFYLGRMRRKHLEVVLSPRSAYEQWHDIGIVNGGVFDLAWSDSPAALQSPGIAEGDTSLRVESLSFGNPPNGWRVFARILAPRRVELACAPGSAAQDLTYHMIRELE